MRKIIITNNSVRTRIVMTNANNEVISDKTIYTYERLADNDYNIDTETIAELCDMTEGGLRRDYCAVETNMCRDYNGDIYLEEIIYEERSFSERLSIKLNDLLNAIESGDIEVY